MYRCTETGGGVGGGIIDHNAMWGWVGGIIYTVGNNAMYNSRGLRD